MKTKEESTDYLKGIVLNLPETPGCYQYLDDSGTIIYVGKAKNLKRRVSSYFNKEQQSDKTRLLNTRHTLCSREDRGGRPFTREQSDKTIQAAL